MVMRPDTATATDERSTHTEAHDNIVLDLGALREEIMGVDDAILDLLARRQALARQVGAAKRVAGAPIVDPAREAAVIRRIAERAREVQVPTEPARELFRRIIAMARDVQG